jgi:hypothetical protein
MAKEERPAMAPVLSASAAFSLSDVYKRGPVLLAFYDRHGSDF